MRRLVMLAILVAPVAALSADKLWLDAAGSAGSANGSRLGVSRSLNNFGLTGATAGMTHNRVGESWWTLLDAGLSRRWSDRLIIGAKAQLGPGQLDGRHFSYRKLNVSATWLWSKAWSAELSDSYVNVDSTIGHVLGASLTRQQADYSISLHGITSAGSAIDSRLVGASLRWQRQFSIIGGIYAGQTSNPATLRQVGDLAGNNAVDLRQVYAGISRPVGRYTLLGVFDYLRLGDARRQEFSLIVTVPLGTGGGK